MSITASAVLNLFHLFDGSAVGITLIDLSARVIRANDRVLAIIGYSAEELQAMTYRDFTHPDDLPENVFVNDRLTSGEINRAVFEKRYIRKTGEICWVRNSIVSIREKGVPTHLLVMTEDISDQRFAEQEVLRTRNILRMLSSSIGSASSGGPQGKAGIKPLTALTDNLGALKDLADQALDPLWADPRAGRPEGQNYNSELKKQGFRALITGELDRFSRYTGMLVALNLQGDPEGLDPGVSGSALLAINLLLRHAYRFSGADAADVAILRGPSSLTVEVSDTGRGSRPLIISSTRTQALEEQIHQLGASLELFAHGKGTIRRAVFLLSSG